MAENPTNTKVSCECGRLSGNAEVTGVPQKSRANGRFTLGWVLAGRFYVNKEDLVCMECHKPALIRA